ncbi:MAG: V-type ATPase 116kDa subunit family protein [Candidatus Hecatellaceae archaeon]
MNVWEAFTGVGLEALLRPARMVRLEVIAPTSKVDYIVKSLGNFGAVQFIDVANLKADKYKGLAERVEKTPREENLTQLSNRISNIIRKLAGIPYPEPLKVREDVEQLLKQIESEIVSLEMETAKLDNMMKVVAEERATIERELNQFRDEYENTRRVLQELGIKLERVQALSPRELELKDRLKRLYERMLELQRVLMEADMAAKLTTPHGEIPNSEAELRELRDRVRASLEVNRQMQSEISPAADKLAKIGEILREILEAVERKLEAAERLGEVRAEALKLKEEAESLERELTPGILSLLGEDLREALREAAQTFQSLSKLEFAAANFEDEVKRFSKAVRRLSRGYEVLEAADRFLGLQNVKMLMEEARKGKPEEVEKLLKESQLLLENVPAKYLAMLERALRLVHLEHRVKVLAEEPVKIRKMFEEVAAKASNIYAYQELVDIELKLENLKKRFLQTGKTAVFEAWVPKGKVGEAIEAIKRSCPEAVVNTGKEERGDKPPTLMVGPRFAWCFQKLVSAFGFPNYHELDPTLIMLISFPIIFGFMFGDMGHGLVLLVGGLLIKPLFDRFKIRGEMWDPLYQGRNLIILCGITSTVIGFFYGEFFGPTNLAYATHHGTPTWYTDLTGIREPPWFSPLENPVKLLKISIIIGIAHIIFGIVLDVVNKAVAREWREILAPVSWLWFYVSLAYLILTYGLRIGQILFETETLIPFFVVPFAGLFVLHKLAGKSGMETFAEGVEKAIASISNTASYGRILALGMAHAIFSDLALMGSGAMFWAVFIIITLFLVIALEGILTFAHTLRLHWVEWFSKFYSGDGIPFEGFRIERRFTAPA